VAEELRWLGAALGPARDWDVFVTETLPPIRAAYPDRGALSVLAEQCMRLRAAAQREARRALRSRRYQRMMVGLASWLATQGWREHVQGEMAAVLDMPVRLYAQAELERRYERVRKRGRRLEALTAEELHALRIAIKKLRYSLDFFAALFETEPVRQLRARLSRLQDVLGTLNDSATLPRLLESLAYDVGGTAAAEARGLLLGWSAGRADALRGDLNRAWKAFRRSETFW
jgi:CHAD domain-containing protein